MKFLFFFLVVGVVFLEAQGAPQTHDEHHDAPPTDFELNPDGNFRYSFKTFDGTAAEAQGVPKILPGPPEEQAETITGTFTWTSPEGKVVNVKYVADETGYHPQVSL